MESNDLDQLTCNHERPTIAPVAAEQTAKPMPKLRTSSEFDFRRFLRPEDVVTWPQGTGEPLGLTERLVAQRHELPAIELFVGMTTSKTLSPEQADRFRFRVLNGAGSTRKLTVANVADIVPAYVSAV